MDRLKGNVEGCVEEDVTLRRIIEEIVLQYPLFHA